MKKLVIRQQHTTQRSPTTNRYLGELARLPKGLTAEQEQHLFGCIRQGDQRARERLIQSHLRFVVTVAKQFRYPGIALDDLISEGNGGLLRAVETYDPTLGNRFLSYAVWWVRERIQLFIERHSSMLPRHTQKHLSWTRYRRAYDALYQQLEREPLCEEIADELVAQGYPVTTEQVHRFATRHLPIPSLDQPLPAGASRSSRQLFGDFLPGETPSAEEQMIEDQDNETLRRWLTILTPREQYVLQAFYGLDGSSPQDLVTIAERLGVSDTMAQHDKEQALIKLRMNWRRQQNRTAAPNVG